MEEREKDGGSISRGLWKMRPTMHCLPPGPSVDTLFLCFWTTQISKDTTQSYSCLRSVSLVIAAPAEGLDSKLSGEVSWRSNSPRSERGEVVQSRGPHGLRSATLRYLCRHPPGEQGKCRNLVLRDLRMLVNNTINPLRTYEPPFAREGHVRIGDFFSRGPIL